MFLGQCRLIKKVFVPHPPTWMPQHTLTTLFSGNGTPGLGLVLEFAPLSILLLELVWRLLLRAVLFSRDLHPILDCL